MGVDSMLVHELEIWHPTFDDDDLDELGHPAVAYELLATVRGLVQPRSAREVALLSQAGAAISDHVIHMRLRDLDPADRIACAGRDYEIVGIRRFDYGRLAHLEVDALLAAPVEEEVTTG